MPWLISLSPNETKCQRHKGYVEPKITIIGLLGMSLGSRISCVSVMLVDSEGITDKLKLLFSFLVTRDICILLSSKPLLTVTLLES